MAKSVAVSVIPKGIDYKTVMKKFGLSRAQAFRVMNDGVYIQKWIAGENHRVDVHYLMKDKNDRHVFSFQI